jgi:hypothetical protein
MKAPKLFYLAILLINCFFAKGQESDSITNSRLDSIQSTQLDNISNDIILFRIIEIQGQIIDNLNYMTDYLYENQKKIEIKLDSVLNVLKKEDEDKPIKRKKKHQRKT